MAQRPVCLTVGGSDSCGGAGIQADLRVFETLGVQGCSAITALTAQNPQSIRHIQASSLLQFEAEMTAVVDYYPVQSIKTGMLFDVAHLESLLKFKQTSCAEVNMVVDPVLIASSGKHLYQSEQKQADYAKLIQYATIWTPNLQEAAFFLEETMTDPVEMAASLLLRYQTAVLLKGGHGGGDVLQDVFCDTDGSVEIFAHSKQDLGLASAHGTGCRLASAIAAYLALGDDLPVAVGKANRWLQASLLISA
ncbi:MAG: hydroxymethylpyrimidine/phosphomethylpyrimidine kinase [Mariprofundaceae bacterium]|nr:hydroxymethylpyrimidine/phosphomethylpyrimidine kinase [Mariprofundaceae bacterium]